MTDPERPTTPIESIPGEATVSLEQRPERRLIRPTGSMRHVVFAVKATAQPRASDVERAPLTLALVLDRSGSMAGGKLATAKRAANAVLERLSERDRAAVVIFDTEIDMLQPLAPVTPALRRAVRKALDATEARASTALHEGWLTGCQCVAAHTVADATALRHCFLLTDGLANVGETDPERIATEAAGVRAQAGIGTSTFGIGDDYAEELLGPLAAAGGGQFHHLRGEADLLSTFVGEVGQLLDAAAPDARLELDVEPGTWVDVVSAYHAGALGEGRHGVSVALGDLVGGDERQVVVRFGLPGLDDGATRVVRARLVWKGPEGETATPWQETRFTYADHKECDAEPRGRAVMNKVGLAHADRVKREAGLLNKQGDFGAARARLAEVARRIQEYAAGDPELEAEIAELNGLSLDLGAAPMPSASLKEMYFQSQRRSTTRPDLRAPDEGKRS